MIIGLDLDNTIISYDNSLHQIAVERGLIDDSTPKIKQIIRDQVRLRHSETEWQKLQVAIYGTDIKRAELMPGVMDFLAGLKIRGHSFQIVSHKTRYPNYGNSKIDLRKAALDFLRQHDFFSESGLNLSEDDVHFLSTRKEKIATIRSLKHQIFIDDLKEIFMEPDFPVETQGILLSSEKESNIPGIITLPTFREISNYIFNGSINATS